LSDAQLLERFARWRDEAAFEALVRRHGPLVLGVCQRILRNLQDAEDAFQATFLILVNKAGSIGRPELLANWLYGVASRTALKYRARAAHRRACERQAIPMPQPDPHLQFAWEELRSVLDEELRHLPEKYRAPLVLCYLEGKTNEEAARILGWPSGSMSSRLARGRELLRERLNGRDRALPAGFFALMLTQHAGPVALPEPLVGATVQAALSTTAKMAAVLAPTAAASTPGTPAVLSWVRAKLAALILVALLVLGLTAGVFAYTFSGEGPSNNPSGTTSPSSKGGAAGGEQTDFIQCH
jgi:RNA polymerase sigma factor (sigma-70 family)